MSSAAQANGIAPAAAHASQDFRLDAIEDGVAAFARGQVVVVVDSEDRENEGDLLLSAAHATTEAMAFIIRHSRLVCLSRRSLIVAAATSAWA